MSLFSGAADNRCCLLAVVKGLEQSYSDTMGWEEGEGASTTRIRILNLDLSEQILLVETKFCKVILNKN